MTATLKSIRCGRRNQCRMARASVALFHILLCTHMYILPCHLLLKRSTLCLKKRHCVVLRCKFSVAAAKYLRSSAAGAAQSTFRRKGWRCGLFPKLLCTGSLLHSYASLSFNTMRCLWSKRLYWRRRVFASHGRRRRQHKLLK